MEMEGTQDSKKKTLKKNKARELKLPDFKIYKATRQYDIGLTQTSSSIKQNRVPISRPIQMGTNQF